MLDVTMVNGKASDQAANWMLTAARDLDERFGEGYAERNPALVAAMVQAASADQHFQGVNALSCAVQELADAMRSTKKTPEGPQDVP